MWDSASEVDGFLNKLNITDYKYYDFSQIYSCSDRTLNDYAVIFIRDALNASEHIIIFNCTGWPDLNNESAVMQFARVARKSGKQLIVGSKRTGYEKNGSRVWKDHKNPLERLRVAQLSNPGDGKSKFSPSPAFLNKNREMVAQGESRNHLYPDFIS